MLDDILEFVFEIILDGVMEIASSKKVPLAIRILLGIILVVFFGGFFGLLLWIGIQEKSTPMIIIALALIVGFLIFVIWKIRQFKKK